MTGEALQVLRQFMLLPEAEIEELDGLARRVHTAAMEKQQEEELLQVRLSAHPWWLREDSDVYAHDHISWPHVVSSDPEINACAACLRALLFTNLCSQKISQARSLSTPCVTLQDPPDEFKDSLMDTLMEDPVILPASKAVLDRSTINRCAASH